MIPAVCCKDPGTMTIGQANLDDLFRTAVSALDAGDAAELQRLLVENPSLACDRLESPGPWLRDRIGGAADGFFVRPYLLWFVAEDPVRNGTLPPNIADMAQAIVDAARRACLDAVREQVDYALRLVAWSWIARQCGVQIALIDVLLAAGASPAGAPDNALVNGNVDAAEHLVTRGAPLTLSTALCLGRWAEAERLAATAGARQKQFALTLAALRGRADAIRRLIAAGADVNALSADLYSHATPLHHAVSAGSLEAVTVLVEAGASLDARDTAYNGTPLGWAEYAGKPPHAEIAAYLRARQSGATR
jgi:peptide-methionine (S)-S-oxide reductase